MAPVNGTVVCHSGLGMTTKKKGPTRLGRHRGNRFRTSSKVAFEPQEQFGYVPLDEPLTTTDSITVDETYN